MLTVFQDYKAIRDNFSEILRRSGYRNDYVAGKLGMTRQNFAAKKQRNSWTSEEMQKILDVIYNDDVEDAIMLEIMRSRKDDETMTYDEYKKEISSWK